MRKLKRRRNWPAVQPKAPQTGVDLCEHVFADKRNTTNCIAGLVGLAEAMFFFDEQLESPTWVMPVSLNNLDL